MFVWWPTSLGFSVKGAVNTQLAARATRHVRVVAFHLAHAAHVAGASKSRELGIDGGISHDAPRPGNEMLLLLLELGRGHPQLWRRGDGHPDGVGLGNSFGGGILQRMVVLDGLSSVTGSLQDFQPVASVGVGSCVLGRRRWWRCRHGGWSDVRGQFSRWLIVGGFPDVVGC